MTFEVGVVGGFRARHHLVGDFGPAREEHEHAYRVEATVAGERLRADGTLLDITVLQAGLARVTADLDGADLNALPGLTDPTPTAEVVARYIFGRVADSTRGQGLATLSVRVWESAEAFAAYSGALV